jgi:translation initiation factor 3 subunit D
MDRAYENLAPKTEKTLERISRNFIYPPISDDPIIRQLMLDNSGTVFGADTIFAALMACPRAVYPWDIVVTRVQGRLIFDKREQSQIGMPSTVCRFYCCPWRRSLQLCFSLSRFGYCQ